MSELNINQRLSIIQRELNVIKERKNDFGKYNYRNAEDIFAALKPLLIDDEYIVCDAGIELKGDRYYVKATASFVKGVHTIKVDAFAREEDTKKGMDSSQITGSATSYARKYALAGLFGIDNEKDPDSDGNSHTHQKPSADYTKKIEIFKTRFQHIDSMEDKHEAIALLRTLGEEVKIAGFRELFDEIGLYGIQLKSSLDPTQTLKKEVKIIDFSKFDMGQYGVCHINSMGSV